MRQPKGVRVLADKFYLTHFKNFQSRIIQAVINNRDSLVIQPTGSGKSLCFQFPAIFTKMLTPTIRTKPSLVPWPSLLRAHNSNV